ARETRTLSDWCHSSSAARRASCGAAASAPVPQQIFIESARESGKIAAQSCCARVLRENRGPPATETSARGRSSRPHGRITAKNPARYRNGKRLDVHRLHFAFTVTYHYLFPQLTMGLALLLVYLKTKALRTGDEHYNKAARFWARIFGINF